MKEPKSDAAAPVIDQRPVKRRVVAGMFQHDQTETECPILKLATFSQNDLLSGQEVLPQMLKPAALQIIFAGEMGIEGRSPDIGRVTDVRDGHRLVAHLQGQAVQSVLQNFPRPSDATVHFFPSAGRLFPHRSGEMFDIAQISPRVG